MTYYQKVLQPGETVLYCKKPHWIMYMQVLVALPVAGFFAAMPYMDARDPVEQIPLLTLFAAGSWLLLFITKWIERWTTEIVVTDKRVILKKGLIVRNTMEMNMNKVETVDVQQSVLGRILNYGNVIIRGTGSSYEPLQNVDDPLALRNVIIVR